MDFFDCYGTGCLFISSFCCNDSRSFFFSGYSSGLRYSCNSCITGTPGNLLVICCVFRNQCCFQRFAVTFQQFQFCFIQLNFQKWICLYGYFTGCRLVTAACRDGCSTCTGCCYQTIFYGCDGRFFTDPLNRINRFTCQFHFCI